ncbi:hypothetical protein SAY86_015670 [Trapa natans]|uniref:TFIIB-type domain-containing protein n=1 Tax=Trapa natans TaxID=22666 RepID=A0AAN7LEL9_TRANT|nr:hypothetical protein SAY86_015670 [Trapa natans]
MGRTCCKSCGSESLTRDEVSGSLLCANCGSIIELETFEAHIGGINDPTGTYVLVGTSGTGSILPPKEKKIFEAHKLIEDLSFKLGLSRFTSDEVSDMIVRITEGEYGMGAWFSVLVGACACIVMRRDKKSLSVAQAAAVVGCDDRELGRMITRVVDFLELKKNGEFPIYNIVTVFDQAVRDFSGFRRLSKDKIMMLNKQGMFLIQCAVKWFITTGRRPMPVVVALLVFLAELNEIDIKIEDVAGEFHATVSTSKRRYKELLEALIDASRALPWGKDVTLKNIKKNAPFVIQYMEMKSMLKVKGQNSETFDLDDVIKECLRTISDYQLDERVVGVSNSQYFEIEHRSESDWPSVNDMNISHECLSLIYTKFLEEKGYNTPSKDKRNVSGTKKMMGVDLHTCSEWWKGISDLSKKLMLEEILEKDVGLDPMPPSFTRGLLANERRRERINAAKKRISRIMSPDSVGIELVSKFHTENEARPKKRRRNKGEVVDWEDFIIEALLLHQVKEEEIEKGHYNTLLDLYVFSSV